MISCKPTISKEKNISPLAITAPPANTGLEKELQKSRIITKGRNARIDTRLDRVDAKADRIIEEL